jgi:hypothetical protein
MSKRRTLVQWVSPPRILLLLPALMPVLGASAGAHVRPTEPVPLSEPVTLFTFDCADEAEWAVVNDGVMGGRSAGFVAVEQGTLRFTGTLVTQGWYACPSVRCGARFSGGR